VRDNGILFHAKYAYMPNSLGYCGPDENGKIREELEQGTAAEALVGILEKFEAAYPFLRLIARSTGKKVFDYEVPEAYWIGSSLLEHVPVPEFYQFSHRELKGRDPREVREFFRGLDGRAVPHHTFYVLGTFAAPVLADGPSLSNEAQKKVVESMDCCRISWGRVRHVGKRELEVEARPLELKDGRLRLAPPRVKKARYNPAISPFRTIRAGDIVSLHWNYACDLLTKRQEANISKYTSTDIGLVNRFLSGRSH